MAVSGDDFMKKKSIKDHIVAPAEKRMPVHLYIFERKKLCNRELNDQGMENFF